MKKFLVISVFLALCLFAAPAVAFTLNKTCITPFVKPGEDATFEVLITNTLQEELVVSFDENLAGSGCPAEAGTPVTIQMGDSLTCQTTKTASTDPGVSTVYNKIHAYATDDDGRSLNRSSEDSCQIFSSTSVPEFPSIALPATFIIGFLGAILLLKRNQE